VKELASFGQTSRTGTNRTWPISIAGSMQSV